MRLPAEAHTARPWRIHEMTPDFDLEDVWALPTPGGAQDFPRLVELATSLDPSNSASRAVRWLFALRWTIGGWFGWDEGEAVAATLRDRLPADLRDAPRPAFDPLPAEVLYVTEDELAAEVANRTVHGVVHLGWVQDGEAYRGQMAVLVKRNGRLGEAYLAAIRPFRHLIVYPALMRQGGELWERARPRARTRT